MLCRVPSWLHILVVADDEDDGTKEAGRKNQDEKAFDGRVS